MKTGAGKTKSVSHMGMEKKLSRWGLFFVTPAVLFFSIFSFFPILNALYTSFFDKRVLSLAKPVFLGIGNYIYLFTSQTAGFWNSLRATFVFTLGAFIPLVIFSLLFAFILTRFATGKWCGFFQLTFYTPAVLSSVVAALIWRLMLDPRGLANQWINAILFTPGIDHKWLSDKIMVQISTMIVYFWKYLGYFIILFITGLSSIPPTIYEAAIIDGASRWQTFWRITIPLLKPTTALVSIMAMLQCLKTFSAQYLFMQAGAPQEPINVITLNIFRTGITSQRIGRASAMSIILFLIMLLFTWMQFRFSKSDDVDY
jgi:multiple sugar transport system permease protein